MIKKAQIKFICIIMSILLGVFGIIFGATYFIMRNVNERHIEEVLEETFETFTESGRVALQSNGLIAIIPLGANIPEQKFYDHDVFNESQADLIIEIILKRSYNYGQIGADIYYKIKNFPNVNVIVATNASQNMALFANNVMNAFLIILLIYVILFFIVWILSFSVFRPIKIAFEKQKRFISDASHELKTPLTIISANADVINQNGQNPWVDNIKSQTSRLDTLVADMLSLAKLDENQTKLINEHFNLSQEVTGAVLPFDAVAFEKNKTLNLSVEPNIYINGDRQSVKKIATILVDNAIKYSSDRGEINVTLKKESNKIYLTVWNTGSSIPDNQAERIFERFYRGDTSRSRESGGSGLGLSIAKGLADKNKWKMLAESSFNNYMKITLII